MPRILAGHLRMLLLAAIVPTLISADAAAARKYKVVNVTNGGTVSGRVILKGKNPPPEKILITKNNDVCGQGYRAVQWVPVGRKKGLLETVVFLKKIKQGKSWKGALPARKAVIRQKKCVFSPWLQVVRNGAEATIKNSDPVLHNIHIRELIGIRVGRARGVKRTMLNEAQPGEKGALAADLKTSIKPRRGRFIAINCEAHNFMFAWMFAADHPYVDKTRLDGGYTITGIPPGKYTLSVWHSTLGLQEKKIQVEAGGKLSHDFFYQAK